MLKVFKLSFRGFSVNSGLVQPSNVCYLWTGITWNTDPDAVDETIIGKYHSERYIFSVQLFSLYLLTECIFASLTESNSFHKLSTVAVDDWNSPCTQQLDQQRTDSLWRQFSVVPVLERTDHVFLAGNTIVSPGQGSVRRKLRRRVVGLTYSPFQAIKSKLDDRVKK